MDSPIQTLRLLLRPLDPDQDAAMMLALLNDPGFLHNIGNREVRDAGQAAEYIRHGPVASYIAHGYGMYAVIRRDDGAWLGNAGLVRRAQLPMADIGYALLEQYAGHGYALEAAIAVREHARAQLRLPALAAIVRPDNARSIHLLEKLGMRSQGLREVIPGQPWLAYYEMSLLPAD